MQQGRHISEKAAITTCGQQPFIYEDEPYQSGCRVGSVRNGNRKNIGEWNSIGQIFRTDAAHFGKEAQPFFWGYKVMLTVIFENVVERHQARPDHAVAFTPAVLGVGIAE